MEVASNWFSIALPVSKHPHEVLEDICHRAGDWLESGLS